MTVPRVSAVAVPAPFADPRYVSVTVSPTSSRVRTRSAIWNGTFDDESEVWLFVQSHVLPLESTALTDAAVVKPANPTRARMSPVGIASVSVTTVVVELALMTAVPQRVTVFAIGGVGVLVTATGRAGKERPILVTACSPFLPPARLR